MADEVNLTEALQKLEQIADWFDGQSEVDVEEGLVKVKEAAQLIKDSKARLASVENEFKEIEKEMSDSTTPGDEDAAIQPEVTSDDEEDLFSEESSRVAADRPVNLDDIPF